MSWLKDLFGREKPIIALLHLRTLPGDPLYKKDSFRETLRFAHEELAVLQDGGADAILIANEFSLPYLPRADYVTVAAMGRIIGELLREIRLPFGVSVVLNPLASIELAAATGAQFVRATFTGAYMGESGLTLTNIAEALRRKAALGLDNLKLLYKVNPESDEYLAVRSVEKIVHSLLFHCFPDVLCVSGTSAGSETDDDLLRKVKSLAGEVPVFCNTGCTAENISSKLALCDGACVGTGLKKDGLFNNHADLERVRNFMKNARSVRGN
jgi:membrane complex biogenesis BtpA family protein